VRRYAEVGLLPSARRGDGGDWGYGEQDLDRVRFLARNQPLDLGVDVLRGT
jgi:DNA-binding transcriptional MerR regulator